MTSKPKSSIITRDINDISKHSGNIYQSVFVVGKRARQISTNMKEELNAKLGEFASTIDNLEEIFENREQIEISKFYERMPKPTVLALEEYMNEKILIRSKKEEENEL